MKRDWIAWLKAAGIRAARTFAQTALAMIVVGQRFEEVDWVGVLSVAAVAAICSILTSLAGLPEVDGVIPEQTVFNKDPERGDDHEAD